VSRLARSVAIVVAGVLVSLSPYLWSDIEVTGSTTLYLLWQTLPFLLLAANPPRTAAGTGAGIGLLAVPTLLAQVATIEGSGPLLGLALMVVPALLALAVGTGGADRLQGKPAQPDADAGPARTPAVLVDAENVRRSEWPNIAPEDLVRLCRDWAESRGMAAVVVFDREAPDGLVGTQALDGLCTVVGTGGESADDWIARTAWALRVEGRPYRLVTSDRELRDRAGDGAEAIVGGGAFARELRTTADVPALAPRPAPGSDPGTRPEEP
jgi:hypothetical protein